MKTAHNPTGLSYGADHVLGFDVMISNDIKKGN